MIFWSCKFLFNSIISLYNSFTYYSQGNIIYIYSSIKGDFFVYVNVFWLSFVNAKIVVDFFGFLGFLSFCYFCDACFFIASNYFMLGYFTGSPYTLLIVSPNKLLLLG